MTSYLYFKCGCSFDVTEDDWECGELCDKHKKELDEEDFTKENY